MQADLLTLAVKTALERIALPLAKVAAVFVGGRGWLTFGYARMEDHARERFGRTGRWLRDQATLGQALERFPALGPALEGRDGGRPLGKVAATSIGRVASAESLSGWIELARGVHVRELKVAVKRARGSGSNWPEVQHAANNEPRDGGVIDADDDAVPTGDRGANAKDESRATPISTLLNRSSSSLGREPGLGDAAEPDDTDSTVRGIAVAKNGTGRVCDDAAEAKDGGACGGPRVGVTLEDDDDDDRQLVRLIVPEAVRTAFDEGLLLHRAVSGHETTVTAFVEALVAEAEAGLCPPDAETVPLRKSRNEAIVERALAKSTGLWAHLKHDCEPGTASALAADALSRLEAVSSRAGEGNAAELDGQLRTLIDLEDELERQLGRLLDELSRRGAWASLGFAGVQHYAEERLGISRRTAESRTRLARALAKFPRMREAYEGGRIGPEAAILVLRILGRDSVDAEVEQAWVDRASEATVKRLRDEVRLLGRWSVRDLGCRNPGPVDDVDWHASLHQKPGDIRERVCRLGADAHRAGHAAVFLRLRLPDEVARGFVAAVETCRRELASRVEQVPWDEPWPDPSALASTLAARSFSVRCRRVPAWVGLLALLEDFVNTWDDPAGMPRRHADTIYVREGWRCFAPGCTSRRNLEDHHVVYRSRGGARTDLSNRVCLCSFHHRWGEHGQLASCRGQAPLGLLWRLGRREVGVWFRNERRLRRDHAA